MGLAERAGGVCALRGDSSSIDCWLWISRARPCEMAQRTSRFRGDPSSIGVPAPQLMAWLTIATELLSGIAILIGGFVSLVGIPSIILLAVAVFTAHLPYGFSSIKLLGVSNGRAQFGPPGYECDLLYIASIIALLLIGPTPWSVDHYRSRARLS